jgi:hypothetical protein
MLPSSMARKPVQDFFLFLLGSGLFAAGIFLFTSQVTVGSGLGLGGGLAGRFGGYGLFPGSFLSAGGSGGFGLLLIPFALGVALLLADSLRRLGWFLIWATSAALGAGILQSLMFDFRPASLWSLLAMVFMIGGGAGLMFRSLRSYPEEAETPPPGGGGDGEAAEARRELQELRREFDQLKARLGRDDGSPPE